MVSKRFKKIYSASLKNAFGSYNKQDAVKVISINTSRDSSFRFSVSHSNRYNLDIEINCSQLTCKRISWIKAKKELIQNYLENLEPVEYLSLLNIYTNFFQKLLHFSPHELKNCKKIEIYVTEYAPQHSQKPNNIAGRLMSRGHLVTSYGYLRELCLYEYDSNQTFHIWANGDWMWLSNDYTLSYKKLTDKAVFSSEKVPDNPEIVFRYVKPEIEKMFTFMDKFIYQKM